MRKLFLLILLVLACVISIAAYRDLFHQKRNTGEITKTNNQLLLQKQTPPPPPPPSSPNIVRSAPMPPEPKRTLTGITSDELERIERLLPVGAKVATYSFDETHIKPAIANVDLDGDGIAETIVIYSEQSRESDTGGALSLEIISRNGDGQIRHSSIRLLGNYIQTDIYDRTFVSFAVRDVTGDGHPEILVTSAVSASLGATLQIFSFNGSSFNKIADVSGHRVQVIDRGAGKSSIIQAHRRNQDITQRFGWNGNVFEEIK